MASRKTTTKKPKAPDAIAVLKEDHETVRGLLGQLENASGARREKLLAKVEQELKVHTQIEEEIFYPAYREAAKKKEDQKLYYRSEERRVGKECRSRWSA